MKTQAALPSVVAERAQSLSWFTGSRCSFWSVAVCAAQVLSMWDRLIDRAVTAAVSYLTRCPAVPSCPPCPVCSLACGAPVSCPSCSLVCPAVPACPEVAPATCPAPPPCPAAVCLAWAPCPAAPPAASRGGPGPPPPREAAGAPPASPPSVVGRDVRGGPAGRCAWLPSDGRLRGLHLLSSSPRRSSSPDHARA